MKKEIILCDICEKETDQTYGNFILKLPGPKNVTGHITDVCRSCAVKIEEFIKQIKQKGNG